MIKKGDLYYPTEEFKKRAWITDIKIYEEAKKDSVLFWEKLAKEIFWYKKWREAFKHNPPYFEWFSNGKINIVSNIFEKNLIGWEKIKDKVAIIWEPEPVGEEAKSITYEELFQEINKLANGLKKLGVRRGERVGIYLPMIPEVIISMLACAKIGAVHSVIPSALSPAELKIRLQISGAKILITADGYYYRGQIINLKQNADEGIKGTKVERIIVVKRADNKITWNFKRDLWWQELIKNESDQLKTEVMDSENPLFILFTPEISGLPRACLHTCGGYTVQTYWTGRWIFDFQEDSILWSTSDIGSITGHSYTVYSPLLNGITTLIYEGALDWPIPERWARIIEKNKVTIFYTAPMAIRTFEKYGGEVLEGYKFENLRLLGSIDKSIDESTWFWFFKEVGKGKCPVVNPWWQTETGGFLITSLPGIGPFKPAFAGLAFPGVRVEVLDEKGRICPPEKKGNLVILPPFAPGLVREIYKDPERYLRTYWRQYGKRVYFSWETALKDENGLMRIIEKIKKV